LLYGLAALSGLYVLAAVLYAIPMISGLLDDSMEGKVRPSRSRDCRRLRRWAYAPAEGSLYHVSHVSEITPWILLTAVDVSDPNSTKPFVGNLERYGLLSDPGRDDGLPVA
jgi:hypothetical protein